MNNQHLLNFIFRECYINLLTMSIGLMNITSSSIPAETIIKNLARGGILNKDKLIETIDKMGDEALAATIRNNKDTFLSEISQEKLMELCEEESVVSKVVAQAQAFVFNC